MINDHHSPKGMLLTMLLTVLVSLNGFVHLLSIGGGNTTQSVKLGHYAATTSATTHQHDEPYLSQVEKDAKWAKDERYVHTRT